MAELFIGISINKCTNENHRSAAAISVLLPQNRLIVTINLDPLLAAAVNVLIVLFLLK